MSLRARGAFLGLLVAASSSGAAGQFVRSTAHAPFPAYESAPRRPVSWSADGRRIFALNPADHRLEVFAVQEDGLEALGAVMTGMEPVAQAELADGRLLVVNALSDSVALVDPSALCVQDVIAVGDEPSDVLVHRGKVFVACARAPRDPTAEASAANPWVEGVVQVYDAEDRRFLGQVELELVRPRALAADGDHVFVVPQHSGNRTSILAHERVRPRRRRPPSFGAQAQSPNPALASPRLEERGAGWAAPHTGVILNEVDAGLELMADRDVVAIHADTLQLAEEATIEVGSSLFAAEVVDERLWIAGLRGFNLFRTEPRLRGAAFDNMLFGIEPIPGGNLDHDHLLDDFDRATSYALPTALAGVVRDGEARLYVAAQSSASVVEVHPEDGFQGAVDCGQLPSGLAVDPEGNRLVVWCRQPLELWTYAIEPEGLRLLHRRSLGYDPEPALLGRGRLHLYDARGAHGNGSFGCVSCHQFADHDFMAWNLGDPGGGLAPVDAQRWDGDAAARPAQHPLKGPMMTQSLRGLDGVQPLHWRGDRPFVHSFREAFVTLQDGEGVSLREAQELASYLHELRFPPNPHGRDPDDEGRIAEGRRLFHTPPAGGAACADCHRGFDDSAPAPRAGRIFDTAPQAMKAPDLRGVYTKEVGDIVGFGLGHEGSGRDLASFLPRHPAIGGQDFRGLEDDEIRALAAFVRAFDVGESPWIGTQSFFAAGQREEADAAWHRMLSLRGSLVQRGQEQQPAPRFELVARLWMHGDDGVRELGVAWSDERGALQVSDGSQWSLDEFCARVEAGAHGYVMAVPPGNDQRLGLDRDEDGLFDAQERAAGTSEVLPDTDRDGYADGQEVALGSDPRAAGPRLEDSTAPVVESHRVFALFASSATLEVVTDEASSLAISLDLGGPSPRRVVSFPLQRRHQVLLDSLPAGATIRYQLRPTDRNGNGIPAEEAVVGEFRTPPACLHVAAIELQAVEGAPTARVRIVDQDGRPAPPTRVRLLWHLAAGRDPRAGDQGDREAVVEVDAEGWAQASLDRDQLPAGRCLVAITVLALEAASEIPIQYEQAVNAVQGASILLL